MCREMHWRLDRRERLRSEINEPSFIAHQFIFRRTNGFRWSLPVTTRIPQNKTVPYESMTPKRTSDVGTCSSNRSLPFYDLKPSQNSLNFIMGAISTWYSLTWGPFLEYILSFQQLFGRILVLSIHHYLRNQNSSIYMSVHIAFVSIWPEKPLPKSIPTLNKKLITSSI